MLLDRDPHFSDDQKAAYAYTISQLPPVRGHVCSVCERFPEAKEDYPRCAKCKSTVYCSRECQKKDWSHHKRWCAGTQAAILDKRRNFILKRCERIVPDLEFKFYLRMTLAEYFFDAFTRSSNASRKMWVFAVNIFLSPIKEEHLAPLASPGVPFRPLLGIPMIGKFMASEFVDFSDQEQFPLAPHVRARWQALRDSQDNDNMTDSISVVVIFKYLGAQIHASVDSILPTDIAEVRRKRELARNAPRAFPSPKRHIDRWLEESKDSKGGHLVCEMGDRDKAYFRLGDLAAAKKGLSNGYILHRIGVLNSIPDGCE